ncbi:hypothetical protein [Streptomyces boncukensis]|uniref:Secreted protein n=1 Tax=Streptomyces boncukensis TaxID=2711219 RepID=A0A6G4X4M5_9ACTN|nr:hypothetical protein [Streptomyces boncukensis]NGO71807.1 hypothetical protein [Streptomyces boncukensis]
MACGRRRNPGSAVALGFLTLALLLSGCTESTEQRVEQRTEQRTDVAERRPEGKPRTPVRLLGDGSTAITGRQPAQPHPRRIGPGRKPPQFVVFSWDGAGEDGKRLFSRFRKAGKKYGASQTYFVSGVYLLPEAEKKRYAAPGRGRGASDIGYLKDRNVRATLRQLRAAWQDGSEIGTHFNGHFCGAKGVGSWTVAQWKSEIRQARWFVQNWKTTTGWRRAKPLPFNYTTELIGGRAPCLEGQRNLLKAARQMGFRYDSSGNGTQVWPDKREGLWDLPLQQIPMPGRKFETLSMDYNFLANQSGTVNGPVGKRAAYGRQMRDGLLQGFRRAYTTNRAPLVIGNHFEDWNGGVYMDAVENVMRTVCRKKDVRCVSFRQLVDWLDAQDPRVLAKLRTLDVGERPPDGWSTFLPTPVPGVQSR